MFQSIRIKVLPTTSRILSYLLVTYSLLTPTEQKAKSNILRESLATIQSKALQGDVYYQGALGLFYKSGQYGLPIDKAEAKRWSRMAANKEGALGLATLASIELEDGNTERGYFLYDEAYLHSNLRELGKENDPLALYCLGMMEMDNPPRNIPKAIRNLEKSAELEFATAQATLGMIYFTGIGVKKDSDLALKWSSKSAQNKIPLGMFYLGLAYSVGDGLERNDDYAIRWIRAAAERELTMAQLTLGMKLALGDGVLKNLELAVQWLRRATLNGSAEAALQLRRYENILLRLDGNPDSFSDQEPINKIASKAINSTLNVDNRGKFADSEQFPLQEDLKPSEINNFGQMNEPDSVEIAKQFIATGEDEGVALNLLEEAALSGESEAMNELGLLAYKNQDYRKAMDWFTKAAEFNQSESLRYIGILYFLGQGVEIDYKIAEGWLEKEVKSGDIEASRYLRIVKQFR